MRRLRTGRRVSPLRGRGSFQTIEKNPKDHRGQCRKHSRVFRGTVPGPPENGVGGIAAFGRGKTCSIDHYACSWSEICRILRGILERPSALWQNLKIEASEEMRPRVPLVLPTVFRSDIRMTGGAGGRITEERFCQSLCKARGGRVSYPRKRNRFLLTAVRSCQYG